MAVSLYFNNYTSSADQRLYEDLAVESIKMYGNDVYYVPRTLNNYDPIYGEDDISSYDKAYMVEMYIKSVDGFTGDGAFYSKFAGLEIRDQIVFTVARRTFDSEVIKYTEQLRPNEGDLIYMPMANRLFVIRYVNKYEFFYQVGTLLTWELTCEMFEYSGETLNTGIEAIDQIQNNLNTNLLNYGILNENSKYITDEHGNILILESGLTAGDIPGDDSQNIQNESDEFIDFTQQDPFSQGLISLVPFILNTSIATGVLGVIYGLWNSLPLV
jgi:hypothetical protein